MYNLEKCLYLFYPPNHCLCLIVIMNLYSILRVTYRRPKFIICTYPTFLYYYLINSIAQYILFKLIQLFCFRIKSARLYNRLLGKRVRPYRVVSNSPHLLAMFSRNSSAFIVYRLFLPPFIISSRRPSWKVSTYLSY